MRQSELFCKGKEGNPKRFPRLVIGHKSNSFDYDRLLLMTAFPTLVHAKFAQRRILPEKEGDTIVFRRYSRLSTVKSAAVVKSFLIDLEAYGESYGDRAQAEVEMLLAA